ncbi:MAG: MopE-related protein [Pseudomonadota bacterium]|nr:MopE-related protein [Pseudomonadota bacterium]
MSDDVADTATPDGCDPVDEVPYNGKDEDCDGADLVDVDGDGFDAAIVGGEDCDDADEAVSPDAEEACGNLADDDCDGKTDEGCTVASAGPPDPGGIYWICGVTSPGLAMPALLVAFGLVLLRRARLVLGAGGN